MNEEREQLEGFDCYAGFCGGLRMNPNTVSFSRQENGDVRVTITAPDGRTLATEVVNKHHWISDVLNVTIHSERPGDYHAWLSHHDGEKDILEGRRGGY